MGRWVRQSWQHISFASDCTAIELRRASDRSRVAILADGPVGVTSARRPQKAVAERLTIMACQRNPLGTPEELDVCSSPPCPAIWVGYQWGMRRRRCFFSSRNSRYPWLKRLPGCLVWNGRTTVLCGLGHQHVGLLLHSSGFVGQACSDT